MKYARIIITMLITPFFWLYTAAANVRHVIGVLTHDPKILAEHTWLASAETMQSTWWLSTNVVIAIAMTMCALAQWKVFVRND